MKKLKENVKWFFKEMGMMYSSKTSFFSKKRIESGIAFLIAQIGMLVYFFEHHTTMDMGSMLMWAGAEFTIAGWTISQIQKEKKVVNEESTPDEQINS